MDLTPPQSNCFTDSCGYYLQELDSYLAPANNLIRDWVAFSKQSAQDYPLATLVGSVALTALGISVTALVAAIFPVTLILNAAYATVIALSVNEAWMVFNVLNVLAGNNSVEVVQVQRRDSSDGEGGFVDVSANGTGGK